MDRIRIEGGRRLNGIIPISGAKNAALPLMIASILTSETLTLKNVPNLADVMLLARILRNHGVDLAVDGKRAKSGGPLGETYHLTARDIVDTTAPYELVSRMRASFWVLGPLLARCGQAKVSMPGGCAIGTRPVDLHLQGLKALGAEIEIDSGYVIAKAPKGGLRGARILFPKVSVGATHNVLMAAALAKGETLIENAASEPEIGDVARCLVAMGAKIEGIGTHVLRIQGRDRLEGARHAVLPDRIESGTFAMAVAATGGDVLLEGAEFEALEAAIDVLTKAGVTVEAKPNGIRVARNGHGLGGVDVETQPFPGFPTDLQAQLMALMTTASGTTTIRETIFENRFMHVQELVRLGADISLHGDMARIRGVKGLQGAPVMATDLRASVSLVIGGLIAEGETLISRVYHLDRGFERLEEKLSRCGAKIERLTAGYEDARVTKPPFILFAHSAYRLGEAYEARQGDCPHVHAWSKTDLLPRLGEADVLCLSGFWENNLIDKIPNVRFIQLCSAGYDHFDTAALKARGIRMANAAGANANAVSEHAFALLLSLTRRMSEARDNQHKRHWRGMISDLSGREDELAGKTVLVYGLGRIGQRIARIAKAFDMRVIGIKRSPGGLPEVDRVGTPAELLSLLPEADCVVLACPLSAETRGLIDAQALAAMKSSALLVNVARGPVVDEPALISALSENRIAGAGIDVTTVEPLDADSPLWTLDNVVLTPHTAGETRRHEANVIDILIENLGRLERGETELRNGVV